MRLTASSGCPQLGARKELCENFSMPAPLLIFDLDGTLIDSAGDVCRTVNLTLGTYGIEAVSDELITSFIGEGLQTLLHDVFRHANAAFDRPEEVVATYRRIYRDEMDRTTKVYPGVVDFLQSYPGPLAIVTNKSEGPTHEILRRMKLEAFSWQSVIGGDTLVERKPHPLPLLETMRRVGRGPEETVMIGDGVPDMEAGRKAGTFVVGLSYGYAGSAKLQEFKPHVILDHFAQLQPWLRTTFGI